MAEAACLTAPAYRPRRARDSPLYRLAEPHHETFKQVYDERFAVRYGFWRAEIERTLWAFLDCGIEEHGFARVRCGACGDEIVVAFSCKRRGICPSCTARRMADTAAHLVDRVLPRAPYRQWVFTVPKPLRLRLARDPAWTSWIGGLVVRAIGAWQRRIARTRGVRAPLTGAVTFVQRFGTSSSGHGPTAARTWCSNRSRSCGGSSASSRRRAGIWSATRACSVPRASTARSAARSCPPPTPTMRQTRVARVPHHRARARRARVGCRGPTCCAACSRTTCCSARAVDAAV